MVVPLAVHRDNIEQAIRTASRIWLGLDFDGTLVGFESHPDFVQLPQHSRSLLQSLASNSRMNVAIISGRELEDVCGKVKIDSIAYSGNHGLEIKGCDLSYENQQATAMRGIVAAMSHDISKRLKDVAGVVIENKRLSLSVHYRLVAPESWTLVRDTVEAVVRENPSFRLTGGKMVWEVRQWCWPVRERRPFG